MELSAGIYHDFASVLTCFRCRGAVKWNEREFRCLRCGVTFPVRAGLIEHCLPQSGGYGAWYKDGADTYEADFNLDEGWSRWITQRIKEAVGKHVILPVPFMLELACGTGVQTRGFIFNTVAERILATDISPEMLQQAVANVSSPSVLFLVQDAHSLDVKAESVDLIGGGSALHHLLRLDVCLSEFRRVLKPGGVAVFFEPFYVGNRMIAFLLQFMLNSMATTGLYDPDDIRLLEQTVRSYGSVIEDRYLHRANTEQLMALDDKHLFVRQELRATAERCGFAAVHFQSLWSDLPQESRTTVLRDIAIDIMCLLQREAGLANLAINFEAIPFLAPFSEFYAEHFLETAGPQEVIVFVRD